jgi:hypothetical protein
MKPLRPPFVILLAAFGLAWAGPAIAWGDAGHRTVCEIAWRNLTPTAAAEVRRLLGAHPVIPVRAPRNRELGWACTYPDNVVTGGPQRRAPEHFVNYPRTLLTVTPGTGCSGAPLCVISAILADYSRLRNSALSDEDRAEALIYLGHWLGDIHQPLHSSFRDDQGGNEVNSQGLCTRSLHSTWDTCMLVQRTYANQSAPSIDDVQSVAASWSASVTDLQRADWLSSAPWQWSAESYAVTLQPAVGYCTMAGGTCQYSPTQLGFLQGRPRTSVVVDGDYIGRSMPVIQRRITQAGVRLAHILNLALDPAYRT